MSKRIHFTNTEVAYLRKLINDDHRPTIYANYVLTKPAIDSLLEKLSQDPVTDMIKPSPETTTPASQSRPEGGKDD